MEVVLQYLHTLIKWRCKRYGPFSLPSRTCFFVVSSTFHHLGFSFLKCNLEREQNTCVERGRRQGVNAINPQHPYQWIFCTLPSFDLHKESKIADPLTQWWTSTTSPKNSLPLPFLSLFSFILHFSSPLPLHPSHIVFFFFLVRNVTREDLKKILLSLVLSR